MKFVKSRSWHTYAFTSRGGLHKTRCGLWLPGTAPTSDTLPMDERSCESCLRLAVWDEQNVPNDTPESGENATVPG